MNQITVPQIMASKGRERLAVLTAYDFQTASMLDEAGIDILLVGDSLGNVLYGLPNTLSVTVDDMVRHSMAVSRAAKRALVVADMPFGSFQTSIPVATENAIRLIREGGAHAVKLEGGTHMMETVCRLVEIGIPVMGHVGLTPQSVNQLGGYKIRGIDSQEAEKIFKDAQSIAQAGAFSVVLECIDADVADQITRALNIPTIGIGAGTGCDGEVLVINDVLGYTVLHTPKFVRPLANLRAVITEAAKTYVSNVKGQRK